MKPGNLALDGEDPPDVTVSHYLGGPVQPFVPTGLAVLTATHPDELKAFNVSRLHEPHVRTCLYE